MTASALYAGKVHHHRFKPKAHALAYRVFWLFADLDELPRLKLRLFSHNRWNLFSFFDKDHGEGKPEALRAYVERQLAAAGLDSAGGSIRLLCMPRVLGYVFNPLSIYYCYASDGALQALLYEVNNTFGERHSYLIPVEAGHGPAITQSCTKEFYVSPFLDMGLRYDFRVTLPGDALSVHIRASDAAGTVLTASQQAHKERLDDWILAKLFVTHPLLTLKVIGAIHWQAVRLLWKGIGMRTRPQAPDASLRIVVTPETQRDLHV